MGWLSRMFSPNSEGRGSRAFSAFDSIKPWLQQNLVDLDTAVFSTYEDKRLMASSGAMIIVGTAKRITQETIGFLVEMDYGRILSTKQFYPEGVATWHKQDSATALELQQPLLAIMEHRERTHQRQRQAVDGDVAAQLSTEFAKRKGRFEDLDTKIRETILLEAAMFDRIPRIVEMFYETASMVYDPAGSWNEQTRRLIEVWEQRGDLYRDSCNEEMVQEQKEPSEPPPADLHTAARKAKEFAAWQHNNAQAARLSNPDFDEIDETDMERKIRLAFMFGAVAGIHLQLGLNKEDFIDTAANFIGMFEGISDGHQLEEYLGVMHSAAEEVDESIVDAGMTAAKEFLRDGRREENESILAIVLGYID
jgi:hypothetical protein